MAFDDDAHPKRPQVLAALTIGLLVYLLMRLLSVDWITASGLGFAAAQLAAELFAPDDDPPGGSPAREIRHG